MEENKKPKAKKYSLELYEVELVSLYQHLIKHKPHLVRVENEIEKIFKENPEFLLWEKIIKEIKEGKL